MMRKQEMAWERAYGRIKDIYKEVLSLNKGGEAYCGKLMTELLGMQKEDGSFAVINDCKVEADVRVGCIYFPTYYATAAIMHYDLLMNGQERQEIKTALLNGLNFATGRSLAGSGFSAVREQLEALKIYKDAGLYEWLSGNQKMAGKFGKMIHAIIEGYRESIRNGRTVCDWETEYKEEFAREIEEYEESMIPYVWYAAYGSNISRERFMRYIARCTDQTEPVESEAFILPYDIFFATNSRMWDGMGVAFLDDGKPGMSAGRIYRISRSQFTQIQRMEGSFYGKRINLGMKDGCPIYTFTTENQNLTSSRKIPGKRYVDTILEGLKETYPEKSEFVLRAYLLSRAALPDDERKVLSAIRRSTHAVTLRGIADDPACPGITRSRQAVSNLLKLGMIREDGRSIREGLSARNEQTLFYTEKDMRELVDMLVMQVI